MDNVGTRDIDDALSLAPLSDTPPQLAAALLAAAANTLNGRYAWRGALGSARARHPRRRRRVAAADKLSAVSLGGGAVRRAITAASATPTIARRPVPMLPPQSHMRALAQPGRERNAVSLFLVLAPPEAGVAAASPRVLYRMRAHPTRNTHATHRRLCRWRHATTHHQATVAAAERSAFELLVALSGGLEEPEKVAWTMIEYNGYFGALSALAASATIGGLLRAQDDAGVAAAYAFALASGGARHASLGLTNWRCSSPIRRYADLHNQHVLFEPCPPAGAVASDGRLRALNAKAAALKEYHARVDTMELAHGCRAAPTIFRGGGGR